jgi:hypothetical protein
MEELELIFKKFMAIESLPGSDLGGVALILVAMNDIVKTS